MQSFTSPSNDQDSEITRNLMLTGAPRRNAEEQLFNKYSYFIREGISKYSIQEEDSFDAYTDAVLSAIDTITKGVFENRSSLKTYLFRIFQNKCVDIVRKKTTNKNSIHRTSPVNEMLLEMSDTAKSVVQHLIDKVDLDELRKKLEELGEKCRTLLGLFAEGYSDKEIAVVAGYKTAEVTKTSRLRCLEKLRQLYKPT